MFGLPLVFYNEAAIYNNEQQNLKKSENYVHVYI